MTPFSQRWDFWSRVALKDGGDDGGDGGSKSSKKDDTNVGNYFGDRDNDGVPNVLDFDDGVGWADTARDDRDDGGRDDDGRSDRDLLNLSDRPFDAAFASARAALGPGQEFEWNGQRYSTSTAEEAPELAGPAEPAFDLDDVAASFEEEATAADLEAARARDEAARQALLESQMAEEARQRAEREAAAAEAERQRQAEVAAQFEAEETAADIDRLPDLMTPGLTAEEYFAQNPQELIDFREEQDRAYQDMLARAEAAEELRTGQTTGASTLEQLYGPGLGPEDVTLENVADVALATGDTDAVRTLLENRPDLVLAPGTSGTAIAVGDVSAGTEVTSPEDIYMANEVETLIEASPEARIAYQTLGLEPVYVGTMDGIPTTNYRDAQGNFYSESEAAELLSGAPTVTIPGGVEVVAPVDTTVSGPFEDVRLQPVDVATPVTVVSDDSSGETGVSDLGMTPRTDLDVSGGIESVLPPDRRTAVETALQIASGLLPTDLAYDADGNGVVTSNDAALLAQGDSGQDQGDGAVEVVLGGDEQSDAAAEAAARAEAERQAAARAEAERQAAARAEAERLAAEAAARAEAERLAAEAANQAVDVIIGGDTDDAMQTGTDGLTGTDVILGGDTGQLGGGTTGTDDVFVAPGDDLGGGDGPGVEFDIGGDDLGGGDGPGVEFDIGGDGPGVEFDIGGDGPFIEFDPGGDDDLGGDGPGVEFDIGGDGPFIEFDPGGDDDLGGDGPGVEFDIGGDGPFIEFDPGGDDDLGGDGPFIEFDPGGDDLGGGDGPGDDLGTEEPPVSPPPVTFECPPGFRRVQMANGGSTCVPMDMTRPRVGPYTGTVGVGNLAGYTPFRPGGRRT